MMYMNEQVRINIINIPNIFSQITEKLYTFFSNVWICFSGMNYLLDLYWIGVHDQDDNDKYVWLNGNLLPNDDENWLSGK